MEGLVKKVALPVDNYIVDDFLMGGLLIRRSESDFEIHIFHVKHAVFIASVL